MARPSTARLVSRYGGKMRRFGGPYTFLVVWGVAVFVNSKTLGMTTPIISTFYFSLLALGLLASVVRVAVEKRRRSSGRP